MNMRAIGFAGVAVALFAAPALAHHSHAMFDSEQTVEIEATVKVFEWTNPHSWLQVMAPNAQGEIVEYSLEMGSPAGLARDGWRPRTLYPDDKVTVRMHPLKNGAPGGSLISIVLPSGEVMGDEYE